MKYVEYNTFTDCRMQKGILSLVSLLVLYGVTVPSVAAAGNQVIDGRILWPGNF